MEITSFVSPEVYLFVLIMGIPAYFLSRFLVKKLLNDPEKQRIFKWVLTIVLAPVFYVSAVIVFFSILFYEPTYDFDKADWRNDIENRWRLADDIVESKMLIGKDTAFIKLTIGNPSSRYLDKNGQLNWSYNLGTAGCGFGVCFHGIRVEFIDSQAVKVIHSENSI